jgi:hypothetical protein
VANPNFSTTLTTFSATVHQTKDRLIAIPASVQRELGLRRRQNNHIVSYSIRAAGAGRWSHLMAKLTYDNEFAIPSIIDRIQPGDQVDVKIHRFVADVPVKLGARPSNPGESLLAIADAAGEDERVDGSERVDEYLYGDEE